MRDLRLVTLRALLRSRSIQAMTAPPWVRLSASFFPFRYCHDGSVPFPECSDGL